MARLSSRLAPALAVAAITLAPTLALAQDGDADGVPDARDLCRSTRSGRSVDSAGCDAFCEVVYDSTMGSAFLRSRLLEVGTADWGSFGTVNGPPVGWHARPAGNLGFVANPADDDWAVYQGDFFVPGTPEEGFGLNVGGTDSFTSRLMGLQQVVGNFTGVRVECRPRICGLRGGGSVYWAGTHSGIGIEQTYSVFNEGLFILIEVTLTNTTATEQTVYYLRNVDPDNMQTVTGDFTTTNTIVSQGDGSATSLALVSATTTAPDSYIALASSDPDARVMHGGFSNRDADGIWACSTASIPDLVCTPGSTRTADIGIALSVRKIIPAGESRSFSLVYTLSAGAIAESIACTVPAVCGDGVVEGTEACDDGDTAAGDGCDGACDVETGWECMGSPSACSEICGDGLIVGSEGCDDGDASGGDGCSDACDVETGWTCVGAPSACDEICGDSLVVGAEPCDSGGESATCDADCTLAMCGDSTVNTTAGEECDEGGVKTATCNADCTATSCGDGVINAAAGEECDDGGESATCDADCTPAGCGDATVNATAGESCDDGNTEGGDGCSATCASEVCGNGVSDPGEECDDAGESATCDADCTAATCGDATVNGTAGESCDDGNTTGGDGCSATCTSEGCGNGAIEEGEECDDGGASASCDADCTSAACGDGTLNTLAGESCDDGNTAAGDGCSADCALEQGDGGVPGPDAGTPRYGVAGGGACAAAPGAPAGAWLLLLGAAALFLTRRRRS